MLLFAYYSLVTLVYHQFIYARIPPLVEAVCINYSVCLGVFVLTNSLIVRPRNVCNFETQEPKGNSSTCAENR